MPDLLKATTDLMTAPAACLTQRTYNVGAISFTPAELAESIRKVLPTFTIEYAPDFRQEIADTWPRQLDDSAARRDWGWAPDWDLEAMTADMIERLTAIYGPADQLALLTEQTKRAAVKREKLAAYLRAQAISTHRPVQV